MYIKNIINMDINTCKTIPTVKMSVYTFVDNVCHELTLEEAKYKEQRRQALLANRYNDIEMLKQKTLKRMQHWYKLPETIERNANIVNEKKIPKIMEYYENELKNDAKIKILLYPFGRYVKLGMPMYKIELKSLTYEYITDKIKKNLLLAPLFYNASGLEIRRLFDDTYEVYVRLDNDTDMVYKDMMLKMLNK